MQEQWPGTEVGATTAQQPAAPAPAPAPRAQASSAAPSSAPRQPRGIRNNNPGNIEDGAFARSLPGYRGSDGRFAIFDGPEAGDVAKTRLLGSYIERGFNTPNKIINRWAPPSENDSASYARFVAEKVGIGPDDIVTADMIPAISAAIYEMENGVPAPSASASDVEWPGQEWAGEEIVDSSGSTVDENGFLVDTTAPSFGTEQNPWEARDLNDLIANQDIQEGDMVRYQNDNGETWLGRYRATSGLGGDAVDQGNGVRIAETGLGQTIGAGALAASEQLPFMQDSLALGQSLMRGQSMGEARADIGRLRATDQATDQGARNVGGLAGFGLGLLAPGAGYISRGTTGVQRMQRAAQVGAGYGALYGAGTSDGSALERLKRGGEGAALGAVSGGLLQGGIDRIASRASRPVSAARRLSREGGELTLGMMLQETPVIGPLAKYGEDLASGYIPFIEGARERSAQSLGRAVGNRSLAPIGERVSDSAQTGYERASDVYSKLGAAYDDVLPRVNAQADWDLAMGLNDIAQRAATDLPADHANRLSKILNEGVVDRFTEGGALDGETFKKMETRLREASQRYQKGGVDDQILADYLDESRDAIRGMIARQNPDEASRIADINRGYANYARMRRATRGPAQMTREGTFTPGELSNAVNQLGTEQQLATRSALMQDLASDARNILPSSMGNTGSGQRAVVGMAALGGSAVVNPLIPAAALGGGALLYSAPAQKALNAVYRATDSRAANEGMQTLLELARRDPAMVPVYQSVLDDLTSRYGEPSSPVQPDVLSQAQAGMPIQ